MVGTGSSENRLSQGRRDRRSAKVALFLLGCAFAFAAVVIVLVPVSLLVAASMESCNPPSDAQFERQRSFVLAHLPDARSIEVGHLDCDDDGRGHVEFSTRLTPAAAAQKFLADPACSVATDTAGSDHALDCHSDGILVFIAFDPAKPGSDGYLEMPPL